MVMNRKHIVISASIVALIVTGFLRFSTRKARASQSAENPAMTVAVALVERQPLANSLTLSGEFRPFQEVDVHAKVAGFIRRIYVDVGDKVKEGQVLAILEVPELNAQVAGAAADIRRSQDAIQRAQSEVERAQSVHTASHAAYSRLKQASEARSGLIAEQELDDAFAKDKESEAQVSSSRAALAEAKSQLSIAQADRARLTALEAYSHITAPFAGVVTKRYADVGSLIQAGTASNTQTMPVVQLAEWSKLRLVLPVPESAVPELQLGSTVKVVVPALKRAFDGRVARFADALDQQTRTMETEVDVRNVDNTLVQGMYAEVALTLAHKEAALTVPVQAVSRNGAAATVMVVRPDNSLDEREVTIGMEGTERLEIASGLKEGERVLVGNRSGFRPGDRVIPKPANRTEPGLEGNL